MGAAIISEYRKFFSTRLWWGMAIAMFVCAAAFAGLFGFVQTLDDAPSSDPEQVASTVYTAGLGVGYLLMLTIGIMQIGSEYRHKTITSTVLATPSRSRVVLAKVVALLGLGAIYGVVALLGSVSVGAAILSLRGIDPFPSIEVLRVLALSLLALGLWALIGLGVGVLIPNMVAAILVGVGVAWIAEPILVVLLTFVDGLRPITPYLPSQASSAMVSGLSQFGPMADPLPWWGGALVLSTYAVVAAVLGTVRVARSDIT